jgi:protein-S-isoprenylcysteine O-methyltransferase Ste14
MFAYLPAYAAVHSFLVSRQFKSLVWRIYGPGMDRWYVKFFSIFAAITLAPLALLFLSSPGKRLYLIRSPWRWLMVAGQIMASLATVLAFTDAPHRFTISQQLRKDELQEPLHPRGIYRFVQDPFLLSGLLQLWLTPFMTTRLLVLYAMSSVYLYLGSLHWESRLRYQFGKEYEDYQKEVPRAIPRALKSKLSGGSNEKKDTMKNKYKKD